jgi:DNA-binding response OmpR family regulator
MSKKILIVDDNELILEVMSYILTHNGYDVSSLNTGDYVVDEVKSTHPDLLILDALLPGMDGRDICKALKNDKDTENLPVIICSGTDDIEEVLMHAGAPNDILRKPFDMTALIKKVQFQLAA